MSAPPPVDYGPEIEAVLETTRTWLAALPSPEALPTPELGPGPPDPGPAVAGTAARWTAICVLEGDPHVCEVVAASPGGESILAARDQLDRHLQRERGPDLSLVLAERRFERAHHIADRVVASAGSSRRQISDRIDRIVTHRIFGPLALLAVMWGVFQLVTNVAGPFVDWINGTLSGTVGPWVASGLGAVGLGSGWVERLAVDGILAGVGGTLAFVPVIAALFIVLGMLEDTGYLARAAYITDRAMAPLGLSGKSVLPLVVGFGCNVPALLATRILDRPNDRLLTGLLVPFVSCSARLPIYVLLAAALFPGRVGVVVFALYLTSVAAVFLIGLGLRHTLMRGSERSPFVLELPPYRRPSWQTVWSQTRQRSVAFLRKAGSVILVASIVVWSLLAIPVRGDAGFAKVAQEDSLFGTVAGAASGVFDPAGFDAPELSGALAAGFVAKEVVVSTMRQTIGDDGNGGSSDNAAGPSFTGGLVDTGWGLIRSGRDALLAVPGIVGIDLSDPGDGGADRPMKEKLQRLFDESSGGHPQPAAAAFLVFVLLYVPCLATVATFGREFGPRWAAFSVCLSLVVAWLAAVGVFQIGRILEVI